jgi:glutaminyl-peptide cyclotransferase
MLVLLDLIGAPDPKFYSYFRNTEKWYYLLVNAEKRLAESRLLARYSYGMNGYPQQKYFQERSQAAGIEDDHIPFMRRGM